MTGFRPHTDRYIRLVVILDDFIAPIAALVLSGLSGFAGAVIWGG